MECIGTLDFIISFYFWSDLLCIFVLIFDLAMVRKNIYTNDTSNEKISGFVVLTIIDILRLARLTKFLQYIFIKKCWSHAEYF